MIAMLSIRLGYGRPALLAFALALAFWASVIFLRFALGLGFDWFQGVLDMSLGSLFALTS